MSIKAIYKRTAIIMLAVAVLLIAVPVPVFAAPDVDIIYTASASANAGDTVNVTISTTSGVSISTLGLRLYYDKEKLTYQRSQWAGSLQNSDSSMALVSDVEYGGSQVLNISMISDGGYQSGGEMVTLVFSVKAGYTENPFRLELREITDVNLQSIESNTDIIYQNTGNTSGGTNPSEEEPDTPGTGNGSSNGNTDSSANSGKGSEGTGTQGTGSESANGNVNSPESEKSNQSVVKEPTSGTDAANPTAPENHPKTFQTGIEDFGTKLLFIGMALGLTGVICIIVRRKISV